MGGCMSKPDEADESSPPPNEEENETPKNKSSSPAPAPAPAPSSSAPPSEKKPKKSKSKPASPEETAAPAEEPKNKAGKPKAQGGGSSGPPSKKKKKGAPAPAAATSSTTPPPPPPAAAAASDRSSYNISGDGGEDGYDPKKWKLHDFLFDGSAQHVSMAEPVVVEGKSIAKGIKTFEKNPVKYVALLYQANMVDWPEEHCRYTLIPREGTEGYKPQNVTPDGWMACKLYEYQRLPPFPNNELPKKFRDKYTDKMSHQGILLHSSRNPPLMPGRGMGICDEPHLKIIGDIDPSDIEQGQVGDCWLLSGISSLAEFDGAIKKLFRKTPNIDRMPLETPNKYIVTLWDLETWTEVDIEIDERLAAAPDGSGRLLSSKPSEDGELWVCYLEKALAVHCGGWDKITGGQCTHAWSLMTGCKHQYLIRKNPKSQKWGCYCKYNVQEQRWARHANSPHDGEKTTWQCDWPAVGGGGPYTLELTEEQLFERLVAWDEENYIVGAGTQGSSDKNTTGGIVDNHAYSVIESRKNVAGTGINLIRVRNPWGSGEIEDGEFDDDGPGWDRYPTVKKELNPQVADDGIFWVTPHEFFTFYSSIFLSASNMTEFLED